MRLLISIVLSFFIFLPTSVFAVECDSFDSKCKNAKSKAELTQTIFKILDAGVATNWDASAVRDSFSGDEKRGMEEAGLDVTNAAVVRALKKTYTEKFSHLDANAWQSVMDTIFAEDYVEKQVKNKMLGVSVVHRVQKELERSGKKTIKSKKGNFSFKSNARTAVVILEDIQTAQKSLVNKLSKAGDDLDIEVLADALERTTIVLVDRNEKLAKQLSNPIEFEKLVNKASKSSGVAPIVIAQQMRGAAAPAIDVIQKTVQAKYEASPQGAAMSTKKVKRIKSEENSDDVIMISSVDDSVVITADMPGDFSTLTAQELRDIHPDVSDDDHITMMRSYARYANLEEADKISQEAWLQGEPGFMYSQAMKSVYDAGYNGVVADQMVQDMKHQSAELWSMMKDVEARVKRIDHLLSTEIDMEEKRDLLGLKATDEEYDLQDAHFLESKRVAETLVKIYQNAAAVTLLSNDQFNDLKLVANRAIELISVSLGADAVEELVEDKDFLIQRGLQQLTDDLINAERIAISNGAVDDNNQAQQVIVMFSVSQAMYQDADELEQQGMLEAAAKMKGRALETQQIAMDAAKDAVETFGIKAGDVFPMIQMMERHFESLGLGDDEATLQMLTAYKHRANYNFDRREFGQYNFQEETMFYEDLNTAAQMAELTQEIQNIQDAIDNLSNVADELRSQGASESDISSYLQDQQNQMQQGMQQLCGNGDPNNPNPC